MRKRLLSWLRTMTKLCIIILGYIWIGAAYKLVYGQTHDLTRFRSGPGPGFPYYQLQFMPESLLAQTWIFGPDFKEYIGVVPPLGKFLTASPETVLADYFGRREREMAAVPRAYPYSLFAEEALDDAYLMSTIGSVAAVLGARERPARVLSVASEEEGWRSTGVPDTARSAALARQLADGYPDSPQAPTALLRLAQAEAQHADPERSRAVFARLIREYPRSPEAEEAANALYGAAMGEGKVDEALRYKEGALAAAERHARERFAGRALPASTTLTVLGYRLDLTSLNLQLRQIDAARELLAVSVRETERVKSVKGLQEQDRRRLTETRERMDRRRSELWIADLFSALAVGVPGPPPRPKEFAVSGKAVVDGRPLSGVEVVLSPRRQGRPSGRLPGPMLALNLLQNARFRGVTDAKGAFRIDGVPAGRYQAAPVYPLQPPETGEAAIVPTPGPGADAFARPVEVEDAPVEMPPLTFRRALSSRTFGELKSDAKAVRLEWDAWPGAAGYRVEVHAAPSLLVFPGMYEQRKKEDERAAFRRRPVLWSVPKVSETHVDCPLVPLAPDNPQLAQMAEYEYHVIALDAGGRELASNAPPLARFSLSAQARGALMALKPPVRGDPRQPGFGRRRRPAAARQGGTR